MGSQNIRIYVSLIYPKTKKMNLLIFFRMEIHNKYIHLLQLVE